MLLIIIKTIMLLMLSEVNAKDYVFYETKKLYNQALPSSIGNNKYTENMAKEYAIVFNSIISQELWERAYSIDVLATTSFKNTSIWQDKKFIDSWNKWLFKKASLAWKIDSNNSGLWSVALGSHPFRPSIGLKKELDGKWWMIFVFPEGAETIHCPASGCKVKIDIENNYKKQSLYFTLRPPFNENFRDTYTLGMPLPSNYLMSDKNIWTVYFKNDLPFSFDLTHTPNICKKYLTECWNSY